MRPVSCLSPGAMIVFSLLASATQAQWVRTNGPSGLSLGSIAADTNGRVYAACDSQWFRSSDDGETWTSMPLSTPEWSGGRFCIGRSNIVFAGTWRGISRSSTFGATWEKAALVDTGITALYIGRDGTVYAGTAPSTQPNTAKASVSRSTDDGVSWAQCAPTWDPSTVQAIMTTPQGTIFVSQISHISITGWIMRSTNAGLTWDTVNQCAYENVMTLALGPDGTIFAGTVSMNGPGGRVLRSTDNGHSWETLQSGLPGSAAYSFVFAGSHHIFVSTLGVYGSTDNGTTWKSAGSGLPYSYVYALARSQNILYAGTSRNGVWRIPLTEVTGVDQDPVSRPARYFLCQNYPNPFNPKTTIRYELPISSYVRLTVADLIGREVSVLVDDKRDAGAYEINFEGSNLASGVYFYRLHAGRFVQTKRFVLLR